MTEEIDWLCDQSCEDAGTPRAPAIAPHIPAGRRDESALLANRCLRLTRFRFHRHKNCDWLTIAK